MANEFGSILKKLRFDQGMTQAEMAEETDLSLRFYQSLESGEAEPGLVSIKKIIEGLNLEPGQILGYPRKNKPSASNTKLIEALKEVEEEKESLKNENQKLKKITHTIPPDIQSWLGSHKISDFSWDAIRNTLGIQKQAKNLKSKT